VRGRQIFEDEDSFEWARPSHQRKKQHVALHTGSGTTTELVVLQVILAAISSANLHFHWFQ
jgi:hypothetical protein